MWRFVFVLLLLGGCGAHGAIWDITIHTSDEKDAGTDSDIYLTLHGSRGSSAEIMLPDYFNDFERNQIGRFLVTTDDIGEVCSLTVRNAGNYGNRDWHLREIVVHGSSQKKFWCNCWLSESDGYQRELQPDVPCSRQ
ncbi:lipoxygenase homology domain-containing protein 1-like [Pomacea canaliculata]|uniref:lipoxygenase homology domain-containing protein 1-like n=1 Tax=Pomacea canaliculata TaxID=400727 RepID=UPI000D7346EF|nr:lipoxygenase homology domain-containing protein 1-like [Pomacea canaliculata]